MTNVITTNTCVNIFGGNNLILPNVTQVSQHESAAECIAAAQEMRKLEITKLWH